MKLRLQRMATRLVRLPAFWVVGGLLLVTAIVNVHAIPVASQSHASNASAIATPLDQSVLKATQSEGTTLTNVRGHFENSGDRIRFVNVHSGTTYVCLENLPLQQIMQSPSKSITSNEWIIRGHLTEFDGTNFLLIDRSIRAR